MLDIPEHVNQILSPLGWHNDHIYDTSLYEKLYEDMGCPIHQSARDFLRKFGGLSGALPKTRRFNFDPYPKEVLPHVLMRNRCNVYEDEEIKLSVRHLVYVGAIQQEHIELLVSEDGQFFGRYSPYLYFVGKDYIEALINICEGKIITLYGDD